MESEELAMKIEEKLNLSDKEDVVAADDYSDSDISLRPMDLTDVDDFMEWYADDNVSMFYSCDTFESKEDAITYLTDFLIPQPWNKAICLNGKPIGSISVTPFEEFYRCRGEIGYELSSKYWGKGIATKAVKMVASTIFVEWPHLARLQGVVDVENLASQRVLEKAGFTKEGVLRKYYLLNEDDEQPRDAVMFSLLSTDPQVDNLALDIRRHEKSSCEERKKNHPRRIKGIWNKSLDYLEHVFGTCLWII